MDKPTIMEGSPGAPPAFARGLCSFCGNPVGNLHCAGCYWMQSK